jgi:hypothetical protein
MLGGIVMFNERALDKLIQAGWYLIESDFDAGAFAQWKDKAFDFVNDFMGSEHTYTRCFKDIVTGACEYDLLAAEGILEAVREQISK